jgi:hypothetical protein
LKSELHSKEEQHKSDKKDLKLEISSLQEQLKESSTLKHQLSAQKEKNQEIISSKGKLSPHPQTLKLLPYN